MTADYGVVRDEVQTDTLQREQKLDPILGEVRKWLMAGQLPPKKELRKRNKNLRAMARLLLGVLTAHNGGKHHETEAGR